MNRHVFFMELKRNKNSLIIWCLSIAGVVILGMAFYPVISDSGITAMTSLFETPLMKTMMSAFGADISSMTDILGYYSTYNSIYALLTGCIFSIMLTCRIIAQEENDKTAEFLLTRPLTRSEIIISKVLAFLTQLIVFNTVIISAGAVCLEIFSKPDTPHYRIDVFLTLSLYGFLLMLLLGFTGLFISLLKKRGRTVTGVSIGIVVGSYFLDAISKITREADFIGYISPFKFVNTNVLSRAYQLDWWRLLYFLGISAVLFILSYNIFKKKDILI
jgi:ABC-2 type transport system permease protein